MKKNRFYDQLWAVALGANPVLGFHHFCFPLEERSILLGSFKW